MSRDIIVTRYEKSTAFLDREQVIDILAIGIDGQEDLVERVKLEEFPNSVLAAELQNRLGDEDMDIDAFVRLMDRNADYDEEWTCTAARKAK